MNKIQRGLLLSHIHRGLQNRTNWRVSVDAKISMEELNEVRAGEDASPETIRRLCTYLGIDIPEQPTETTQQEEAK